LDYLEEAVAGNILHTCKKTGISRSAIYLWRGEDKVFNSDASRYWALGNAVNCNVSNYLFNEYLAGLWW